MTDFSDPYERLMEKNYERLRREDGARTLREVQQRIAAREQAEVDAKYRAAVEQHGIVDFGKQFARDMLVRAPLTGLATGTNKLIEAGAWAADTTAVGMIAALESFRGKELNPQALQETEAAMGERRARGVGEVKSAVNQAVEAAAGGPDQASSPKGVVPPSMKTAGAQYGATTGEALASSMVQFFTLYGPALKAARNVGVTGFSGDMTAGFFADMLAFENKQGTFSDLAIQLGFDNELTQYLSGKQSDNEFDASLKAGLEGAGLGLLFSAIAPAYRGLKSAGWTRVTATAGAGATAVVAGASPQEKK